MLMTSSYAQVAIYVVGLHDILPIMQELQQFWWSCVTNYTVNRAHVTNDALVSDQGYHTVEHAAQANKILSLQERRYCNWLAGTQDGWWYDSYINS